MFGQPTMLHFESDHNADLGKILDISNSNEVTDISLNHCSIFAFQRILEVLFFQYKTLLDT